MKKIYKKIEDDLLSGKNKTCRETAQAASGIASEHCASFVNEMKGEEKEHPCPCSGDDSGGGESAEVDLIILCDATGSMSSSMRLIADTLQIGIKKAKATCKKNADPPLLYVDQADNGSTSGPPWSSVPEFSVSHEEYLKNVDGYGGTFRTEGNDGTYASAGEEGAEAIIDLCKHHKWKNGSCRAILYISDTYLDSDQGTAPLARSAARMNEAIVAANKMGVTIFAHLLPQNSSEVSGSDYAALENQYKTLASQTNGVAVTNKPASASLYEGLIEEAICKSCANAGGCAEVEWPEISPCVHVTWGAAKCDSIESHDDEVICITLCNCYSNVTFQDVRIGYVVIVDEKGNLPPLLPDGSPSVHIYPTGPVCYGDIMPCENGKETCVSHQFVLLTRGAVEGNYTVKIGGLCFKTCHETFIETTDREFRICKD